MLRAVGDPLERFREDALRPLRVARLAAQLEMEPERETRTALGAVADRAGALAIERVQAELMRMMQAAQPSRGFEILREAGLLALWLPELAACRGVPQNRFHAYDVYFHSLYSADAAQPTILKIAPGGASISSFGAISSGAIGLTFDSSGNLYAAEYAANRIDVIKPNGDTSLFADQLDNPRFLAIRPTAVPEPSSWALLAVGLSAIVACRRLRVTHRVESLSRC